MSGDSDPPVGDPPPVGANPVPGTVTVIVTVLRDPRVARTLESLLHQTRAPQEVLVDDGGGAGEVRQITESFHARNPVIRWLDAPGNIPESRNTALRAATGEFVAFLDADEVAPPDWLAALLAPFADPRVGFVGGPTPAMPETLHSIGARYYDGYLRRFYDTVARENPHALPMGNSAWRIEVFRQVGLLDTTLFRRAASEDQEVAVRALRRAWKGVYAPEAWVAHDFSEITTLGLLRKQATYAEGGFVVWRRVGTTYEASVLRVLPYIVLPIVSVVGAALVLPWFPTLVRLIGAILLGAGLAGLAGLFAYLTATGRRADANYPGLRYSGLEILRRWATLLGALRGLVHYGPSGRRVRSPT